MVEHELEERRQNRVLQPTTTFTDGASLDQRVRTIKALVNFCLVQETSLQKRAPPSRDWGRFPSGDPLP